jgi:hypothetical protein
MKVDNEIIRLYDQKEIHDFDTIEFSGVKYRVSSDSH